MIAERHEGLMQASMTLADAATSEQRMDGTKRRRRKPSEAQWEDLQCFLALDAEAS